MRRILAIALAVFLNLNSGLQGQQAVPVESWAGGFHGLAMIARSEGLTVVTDWNELNESADELVLFVAGKNFSAFELQKLMDRGASVIVAIDSNNASLLRRYGITFRNENWCARSVNDMWNNSWECPVVRDLDPSHPATKGVDRIATNRPAVLEIRSNSPVSEFSVLGRFPPMISKRDINRNRLRGIRSGMIFAMAGTTGGDGKLLVLADPSVFCNQMMVSGHNARFAIQAMNWLATGRSKVAFAIDGRLTELAGADEAELQLPPPTPEEVLEALRNLPADKMLEFGNTMTTLIEDENLVNDFLAVTQESFSDRTMRQILVSVLAVVAGFFIWFGFFSRDSLLDSLFERNRGLDPATGVVTRQIAARQRRLAAKMLIRGFMQRIGDKGRFLATGDVPQLVARTASGEIDPNPQRQLARDIRSVFERKESWWTPRRLRGLETRVGEWTRLHELGQLVYDEQGTGSRKVAKS